MRTSAELNPQSLSEVFLDYSMVLTTFSLLRFRLGPTISSKILLVIVMATSARPLDYPIIMSSVLSAVYLGLWLISSGNAKYGKNIS